MDYFLSLRTFCAVVEGGSFAAAAGRLRLSRAMVSKHVIQLEDQIQARLLNRSTRRVSLTESGAKFFERATHIMADLEDAERETRSESAEPRGTLKINAPHTFATAHIAPFIPELLALYPDLNLDIAISDRIVDPVEEGFDVSVRITSQLQDSSLVARRLAPCRLVVCGTPEYFARHGEPLTPDDLRRHNCLGYTFSANDSAWEFVCSRGNKHVVRVGGRVSTNSGDMLRAVTLSGSGVMLMPTFIIGSDLEAGRLKAVLTDYRPLERDVYAIYASRKNLSAKVRAFVQFFEKKFGPEPYWDNWLKNFPAPSRSACGDGDTLQNADTLPLRRGLGPGTAV
jgi:DNA-binding transcriptional LysR family regulator